MTDNALELPPQAPGQALTMLICERPDTVPAEVGHWFSPAKVTKLLEEARAQEREACAKVCDHRKEVLDTHMPPGRVPPGVAESAFYVTRGAAKAAGRCASAIRARSKKDPD